MSRRETTRQTEPAIISPISTRNGPPSVEAPNAWIESRIPERTRNVPMIARIPVARTSEAFQIFSIPRFSWTMIECRNAVPREPRQQRGVLHRVPGPVAAPAELGVAPAGAEEDADAEEEPGGEREAPRGPDPLGADPAGDQRADREGERAPRTACTPSTASGGGTSCSGGAAAGSGPCPPPARAASCSKGCAANTSSPQKNAAKPSSTAVAHGAISRSRRPSEQSTTLDHIESSHTQSSSEPSCEDQAAVAL